MIKRFFRSSLIILLIIAVFFASPAINFSQTSSTVRAVGDLTVVWSVPEGNPIFTVSNMAPGDSDEEDVQVTNDASSSRPVGIKANRTGGLGNLESVLNVVISEGTTDLYGGTTGSKTLEDFFNESTSLEFIPLSDLGAGATTTYKIKVTFDSSAGNTFQNTSVIFDLIIGVGFDLPAECENLDLETTPIFGTSGNDNINGTSKNDLIITFEGNDRVLAKGGDDCIIGGTGNDQLRGETGNDVIFGNEDNDLLIGATGQDLIFGGSGNDDIRGENGEDNLFGEEGADTITGGNGQDSISGGSGNDNIKGENGNDTVTGDEDEDSLDGGNGSDSLTGNAGTDVANGKSGTDTCDAETEIQCEI